MEMLFSLFKQVCVSDKLYSCSEFSISESRGSTTFTLFFKMNCDPVPQWDRTPTAVLLPLSSLQRPRHPACDNLMITLQPRHIKRAPLNHHGTGLKKSPYDKHINATAIRLTFTISFLFSFLCTSLTLFFCHFYLVLLDLSAFCHSSSLMSISFHLWHTLLLSITVSQFCDY